MNPTVKYKKLDPRAQVPAYATPGAAAADLCAVLDEPLTLAPMQRTLVPTGLAIELPDASCVALVYARSGLSIKHGLCMASSTVTTAANSVCRWSTCRTPPTPSSPASAWPSCASPPSGRPGLRRPRNSPILTAAPVALAPPASKPGGT